jgi:hypothetical protein
MKKEKRTRQKISGSVVKNQTEKPGNGADKAPSPFHTFQVKLRSINGAIKGLKRRTKSKKEREFLSVLEMKTADLYLNALAAMRTPIWRINPSQFDPSLMDRFLLESVAGLGAGECETLMVLCDTWERELSHDPGSDDRTFGTLVLPFLGELSGEEKSALAGIYRRWATLLSEEQTRRFKQEKAALKGGAR